MKEPKALIGFSNIMHNVYKSVKEYNPGRKCSMFLVFDMIADTIIKKKFNQIVTEVFIRWRKLNISTVFITQSNFAVPKDDKLNSTHF